MNATIGTEQLTVIAQKFGLEVLTVIRDFNPDLTAEEHHNRWLQAGNSGEMQYLQKAHSDLKRLLPEIQSALVFAVKYTSSARKPLPRGYGRVARYAWGKDYHKVIPRKLKAFVAEVEVLLGTAIRWRSLSDSNPLLEKALAARAGIGFYGKNSLIIRPGIGSYTFLAELLWDVTVRDTTLKCIDTSCGSCNRCKTTCPTQAITNDYTVDSRRCISYLTIEKRGMLSIEERGMLGDWLFGCDICQEVCPFNAASAKTNPEPAINEFAAEHGAGEFLSLKEILSITNDEIYLQRFAGTPLMRAKREGLLRNALCVAVNTDCGWLAPEIEGRMVNDSSPLIRRTAFWAALNFATREISGPEKAKLLIDRYRKEPGYEEEICVMQAC